MSEDDRLQAFVTRLQATGIRPRAQDRINVTAFLCGDEGQDGTNYRPGRAHPLPLAVFRAEEKKIQSSPRSAPLIADEAWAGRASRRVRWSRIRFGDALTLVREPHVAVLATQLCLRLAR